MPETPTIAQLQAAADEANARADELQRQLDATRAAMAMRSVRASGAPGKTFRFYVDRKIVRVKGVETGGDHARIVDVEADDLAGAEKLLRLKKGEVVNQVVSVTFAEDLQ
jgi:hypothetical protein